MKKIIYTLIFILFLINYNQTYPSNYNTNIKKIELVEKYITEHNKKINLFIKKYEVKNNNILNKNLEELNKILSIIKNLKNKQIDKQTSDNILKEMLNRIKVINSTLKEILKKEKTNFNDSFIKTKKYYGNLGIHLSTQLDTINIKIAKNIFKNKKILNKNENEIKKYLIKLNIESNKLKKFGIINFNSEDEIKKSFTRILKNIKKYIKLIKLNL